MIWERKRIYIVVKTYPTISQKYAELVCTAGVLEDGSWIRLYPVPFRMLNDDKKYKKYVWVEIDVKRNEKDFRPETYLPDLSTITVGRIMPVNWDERRAVVFRNKKVYTNMQELIADAKKRKTSLAIFKPKTVHSFEVRKTQREWDQDKISALRKLSEQTSLLQTPEEIAEEFRVVQKVPYKFLYTFEDDSGRCSTLMIEDWEIGMLYFNCLKRAQGNEKEAIEKVRQKYFTEFTSKDLHLFLGTTLQYHLIAPNPFVIIGVFSPPMLPYKQQMSLFDM